MSVIHGLSKIQCKLDVLVWFWSMHCSDLQIVSPVHRLQLGHCLLCRVTVCYYAGPDMVLYSYRLIFRWVACTCVPCFQRELNDTARRTKEQGDLCYFESYIKVSDKALRCGLTVSCEDSAASIAVNYSVNWLNSSDAVRAACLMLNWRHVIIENKKQLVNISVQ